MASEPVAARLARHITSLDLDRVPRAAVEKLKDHVANHLGLAFTGRFVPEGRQAVGLARDLSAGRGDATVIGEAWPASVIDAAFANTTLMRANGQDDVLFPAGVHAALVTMPIALALGETLHRSGREVLTALVVGYDAIGKLASGVWSWAAEAPRRPTIPFGPFGAVAVASRLLGLDAARTANAIGYAAHSAMGLAEGDLVTHYYGLVSRNGLMAAYCAAAGGLAAEASLEGRFGFYRTFFGATPPGLDASLDSLGREFEIMNATTKRYPGTALNIVPIELLRALARSHHLNAADVERLDLYLPRLRENFEGGHGAGPFTTRQSAVSSVLFALALVLLGSDLAAARWDRFDDPDVAALVARMFVTLEERANVRYARIAVRTSDGATLVREGDDFVFSPGERSAWLARDGGRVLPAERLPQIAECVDAMETLSDVSELTSLLRA